MKPTNADRVIQTVLDEYKPGVTKRHEVLHAVCAARLDPGDLEYWLTSLLIDKIHMTKVRILMSEELHLVHEAYQELINAGYGRITRPLPPEREHLRTDFNHDDYRLHQRGLERVTPEEVLMRYNDRLLKFQKEKDERLQTLSEGINWIDDLRKLSDEPKRH